MPLGRIYDLVRDGDRCVMVYESKDNPGENIECAPGTIVVCSNFQLELSGVLCDAQTIANAVLLERRVNQGGA
jgi:hypothetical protein